MSLFGDINKVEIMGNLTQDPELRFTPNGSAVASFSVATNRRYKQGDEYKDETTFHNIVVWGNLAQALSQRAKKGTTNKLYNSFRIGMNGNPTMGNGLKF